MRDADHTPTGSSKQRTDPVVDADPDELLTLLGDEYTRRILSTLGEEALCAREIADRADISRPTVYRRLNRLVSAGVVETGMTVDRGGHHRKQFQISVDDLEIRLDGQVLVADSDSSTSGDRKRAQHGPVSP